MALYKYTTFLGTSSHEAFDIIHQPASVPEWSGIYRCEGCGREITSNKGNQLPAQNHHQHTPTQGMIRWRLIVYAQTSD
jgi:hypothetical protein